MTDEQRQKHFLPGNSKNPLDGLKYHLYISVFQFILLPFNTVIVRWKQNFFLSHKEGALSNRMLTKSN